MTDGADSTPHTAYQHSAPFTTCLIGGYLARPAGASFGPFKRSAVEDLAPVQDEIHRFMRGRRKHGADNRKWDMEVMDAEEIHRDTGLWARLERVIDKFRARYTERVTLSDGRVLRDVDEPLSSHQGRGAAKRP
jgi:hypothetical protein